MKKLGMVLLAVALAATGSMYAGTENPYEQPKEDNTILTACAGISTTILMWLGYRAYKYNNAAKAYGAWFEAV